VANGACCQRWCRICVRRQWALSTHQPLTAHTTALPLRQWGVIGIKYRQVPCDFKPQNPAPAISNPSPSPSEATWGHGRPLRDWPEAVGDKQRQYVFYDWLDKNW
jgi:hypothetical protein